MEEDLVGVEHQLQDALWAYGTGQGEHAPKFAVLPDGYPPGIVTPNQRKLYLTVIGFQQWQAGVKQVPVLRLLTNYKAQDTYGHCCDGVGVRTEIGTGSHGQLWLAGGAGDLALSRLLGSAELQAAVEAWWQTETALCRDCLLPDRTVLMPGTRDGSPNQPQCTNSNRDKVVPALLDGWTHPPRPPRVGSYDASIPLLQMAFARDADPGRLVGQNPKLPGRFTRHVQALGNGDYYAWFESGLEGALESLWGAGWVNGERVLHWDCSSAKSYGDGLKAA
jgi:hypothetical protein